MNISWFPYFGALFSGDTLFQMAEVHRQIQVQLEDVVSARRLAHVSPAGSDF